MMMVYSARLAEGGGCSPTPFHSIQPLHPLPPESVVINDFYAWTGAWEGAEHGDEQLLIQLSAITLVVNIFRRRPVLYA